MNMLRSKSALFYGALLWIMSIQYYMAQLVVASRWSPLNPYSWTQNTISDLGNTHCGLYGNKQVCSPLHAAMNSSFIVLGITMFLGALLLQQRIKPDILSRLCYGFLCAAGLGSLLVGLFPENTISSFHIIGAALAFVLGNIAMVIFGFHSERLPTVVKFYSITSGVIGLVALSLFYRHVYLGIGIGGMERITSYPLSIWMIVIGFYFIAHTNNCYVGHTD